jgi:hypothetical protein
MSSFPYHVSVGGSAILGMPEQVQWTAVPDAQLHEPEHDRVLLPVEGATLVGGVALQAGIRAVRRFRN